jgi:hypothetical protein
MERQWREERRVGGTEGNCGCWTGFWAKIFSETAVSTMSTGQRRNVSTVSSRMTQENTGASE